jgi:hypothetical protein
MAYGIVILARAYRQILREARQCDFRAVAARIPAGALALAPRESNLLAFGRFYHGRVSREGPMQFTNAAATNYSIQMAIGCAITGILALGQIVRADETTCEKTTVASCGEHERGRSDESRHGASAIEYCQKVASLYCGSAEFDSATGTIRPKAKRPEITAPGPAPSEPAYIAR